MTDRKKPGRHWPGFFFAAMACATFAAQAQQVNATGDYLSRMDVDQDGRVSLVEYQDWLSYAFDGMDKNRDGTLSPEEQPGGRGRPITRTEHRERLADRFKRQDANHDGFLSAKELSAPPQ
jgi:Ca2+-binding EF-hand superfamily protein